MENWHIFTAAFVLSVVDLSVLGAFLWYQFSTLYFAWHLCPMIVNRLCELIAFMFTGEMLPSLFAIVQVPLSLFSTTIYANRQQRLQNKLLLAVYCTLLVYEFLVAVLMIKMGRYLKRPASLVSQSHTSPGQQDYQRYIAFHMFALFTQPLGSGCPFVRNSQVLAKDPHLDGFVTVQQPDGGKVMLGKVLQSKLESPTTGKAEGTEGGSGKETDVSITISKMTVTSDRGHETLCNPWPTLPTQPGEVPFALLSTDSMHHECITVLGQSTASPCAADSCRCELYKSTLPTHISKLSQSASETECHETSSGLEQASSSIETQDFSQKTQLRAWLYADEREISLCEMV